MVSDGHHVVLLLMKEILHHLLFMKSSEKCDILHINWCRIPAINSISCQLRHLQIEDPWSMCSLIRCARHQQSMPRLCKAWSQGGPFQRGTFWWMTVVNKKKLGWLIYRGLSGNLSLYFTKTFFLRLFLHECHQCFYTYIVLNPFLLSKAWAHAPIMALKLLLATRLKNNGSSPLKNGWLEY